jgi:hypothetical protein
VHEPVRITRDVLARSFNETKHLVREPVGVSFEEYKLLEHEPTPNTSECTDLPWEAVLLKDCEAVPQATLAYWRSYQAFAKDRRVLLSKNGQTASQDVEAKIKEEWQKLKFADALRDKNERATQQRLEDVKRSIGFDPSMPSGSDSSMLTDSADTSMHDASIAEPHADMVKRTASAPPTATRASKRPKTEHIIAHGDEPNSFNRRPSELSTDAAGRPATPSIDVASPDPIYRPGKFDGVDVSHVPCEACKVVTGTRSNPVLLCDGCNRGFHASCYKISQLPIKDCDWLCESCIQPGQRISVFFKRDKAWHNGVVRAQHPNSAGTEVAYENGVRALENLNALKWRPIYTTDL